jgi:hypothetical protein
MKMKPYDSIKINLDKNTVELYWDGRVVEELYLPARVFNDDSIVIREIYGFIK